MQRLSTAGTLPPVPHTFYDVVNKHKLNFDPIQALTYFYVEEIQYKLTRTALTLEVVVQQEVVAVMHKNSDQTIPLKQWAGV